MAACTDIGQKRQNNEDSFLVFDLHLRAAHQEPAEIVFTPEWPGLLLAVADGMGGHRSGEVASQLCLETLSKELLNSFQGEGFPPADRRLALKQAFEACNQVISDKARQNPEHEGMGTTLTAALLNGTHLDLAQVGDSRAYLLRQGALTQLTTDQTVANYLLATQQELQVESHVGEMLVQAVGAQPRLDVALTSSELELGDLLLLCSDGLYKVVSSTEIAEIAQPPGSLQTKVEGLITRANERGGPDNVTVVLAEVRNRGAE